MKKSIIYFGIALLAFTNVALASGTETITKSNFAINRSGATPLAMAICKGELEIVKKFVDYGADVNEKSNGLTPLMLAARYNNVEILKFLISRGALTDVKNDNGLTALKFAEISNANEALAYLKSEVK